MNDTPRVYAAIAAVTRALARQGIAKSRINIEDGYRFRGIDDVYAALSPLLSRHRLCMLPRMLDRGCQLYRAVNGDMIFSVWVRAAFDFISVADGSLHSIETFGEAMDAGDKGTSKAMSAAFKYAAMQSFCIPVTGEDDADRHTAPRITHQDQSPPEGWSAWTAEIIAITRSCETHEALDRVQNRHRQRLRALSLTDAALYAQLGEAIRAKRTSLPKLPQRAAA